uniref:BTB domain-containing protein n=1 Tax=Steinernema glaseri TaxID=37863 RepID=A0A1I8A5X0_9BILA
MEPSSGDMSMSIESSTGTTAAAAATHLAHASETEIRVENIARNWTVRNFSHCYQEYLENFVNLPRGDETLTWSIKIYPKGNGENNKEFVFLCLNRVLNSPGSSNSPKNKIGFKSRFILRNAENKEIEMRIHPNPSHSDYVSYIKRDVLFPQIMPADSITITVEIAAAVDTVTTTIDEPVQNVNFEKQLGEDYLKLLHDDVLTDFTIRVGDRDIHTHKAILAARSPVFSAMFTHTDTKEAKHVRLGSEKGPTATLGFTRDRRHGLRRREGDALLHLQRQMFPKSQRTRLRVVDCGGQVQAGRAEDPLRVHADPGVDHGQRVPTVRRRPYVLRRAAEAEVG